jgi:uncharacterized protein
VVMDVKVVPGSSRDKVVGLLGGALKVKVAAPPEDGKANRAVCELLAGAIGVPVGNIQITGGHSKPMKRVAIGGVDAERLHQALGL